MPFINSLLVVLRKSSSVSISFIGLIFTSVLVVFSVKKELLGKLEKLSIQW